MKTIWKYTLEAKDEQILKLPECAEVLSVVNQNDNIVLYALVNSEETKTRDYTINIYGTGNPVEKLYQGSKFLGTVLMFDNLLVWHVWYM